MKDMERELRELGARARERKTPVRSLSGPAIRRIKLRRFGAGAMGLFLVVTVAVTGMLAGDLGSDDGKLAPGRPSPATSPSTIVEGVDDPYACRTPSFVPSYLPDEWRGELQPYRGSGLEAAGVAGHWGRPEEAPSQHSYVDLLIGESPYRQSNRSEVRVLGAPATFGGVSGGKTVEFTYEGCDFVLYGSRMTTPEFLRFAKGLRPTGEAVPDERDQAENDFAAIWPEDTYEDAREACEAADREHADKEEGEENVVSIRSDPQSVILEFGYEVLGWGQGETFRPTFDIPSDRTVFGLRRGDGRGASPRDPEVIVDATEVQPGCWSVAGVSRMPDKRPTGVSVSVEGRDVEIGVDPLGATSLSIKVVYAGRKVTERGPVGEEGLGEFRLPFDPDTGGHALVLFLDAEGKVFSATSPRFPAGDFAAG